MATPGVVHAFVPFTHVLLGVQPAPELTPPSADRPLCVGSATPKFEDFASCREWVAAHSESCMNPHPLPASASASTGPTAMPSQERRLLNFLHNQVRKCPSCGKSNAQTLATCNSCGNSLAHVGVCETPNEFAGFVLSVGKVSASDTNRLEISLRHECPDFIVADDKHSLSPCHVNCLPTKQIVPDWRYLLRKPRAGLALIRQMKAHCVRVVRSQFFSNEQWAQTYVADAARATRMARGVGRDACSACVTPAKSATKQHGTSQRIALAAIDANCAQSRADPPFVAATDSQARDVLRAEPSINDNAFYDAYLAAGFNHPPSQNQLHLQCMYPGLVPYQYWLFSRGKLFTEDRFFTFEYVEAALQAVAAVGVPNELLHHDVPIAALTAHLKAHYDLDAAAFHRKFIHRFDRLFHEHEPWYPRRSVASLNDDRVRHEHNDATTQPTSGTEAPGDTDQGEGDTVVHQRNHVDARATTPQPPSGRKEAPGDTDQGEGDVVLAPSGRLQFRYVAATSTATVGKERLLAVPVAAAGGSDLDSTTPSSKAQGLPLHEVVLDQLELKEVIDEDRRVMQGYGRPYVDGEPRGVYYAYPPNALSDLVFW